MRESPPGEHDLAGPSTTVSLLSVSVAEALRSISQPGRAIRCPSASRPALRELALPDFVDCRSSFPRRRPTIDLLAPHILWPVAKIRR